MAAATASAPLYIQIAESVIEQIENGTLRAGEKVASIRRLSRQKRVGISTALQAYMWLENRGHLEARPKSLRCLPPRTRIRHREIAAQSDGAMPRCPAEIRSARCVMAAD